ncbi:MAG: hypothetical protein K2L70_09005 [Clostridia bacterium]|nr:hypothetical protein [Clostridia bacterium]
MKKLLTLFLIIIITMTLVSCMGQEITPNKPYDMTVGIEDFEFKEITFTVASYNIKGGDATLDSIKEINNNIIGVGADIAGLQEVDNFSKRSGKKDFLGVFKDGIMNNVVFFPLMLQGFGDTYGIASISKTPFSRTHAFKLPYPYKYEKSSVEKRIISRSLVTIDGVQIAFYNTHLSYEEVAMPDGQSLRATQMKFILDLLESDPCPYKIVTGDFNVLGYEEFDIITKGGKYKTINNSQNAFNTYRGHDVDFFALDNIIYSTSLQLQFSRMNDSDCSDHNMLYASFKTMDQ